MFKNFWLILIILISFISLNKCNFTLNYNVSSNATKLNQLNENNDTITTQFTSWNYSTQTNFSSITITTQIVFIIILISIVSTTTTTKCHKIWLTITIVVYLVELLQTVTVFLSNQCNLTKKKKTASSQHLFSRSIFLISTLFLT